MGGTEIRLNRELSAIETRMGGENPEGVRVERPSSVSREADASRSTPAKIGIELELLLAASGIEEDVSVRNDLSKRESLLTPWQGIVPR